jgi:hypothetical protein
MQLEGTKAGLEQDVASLSEAIYEAVGGGLSVGS